MSFRPGQRVIRISAHHYLSRNGRVNDRYDNESQQYEQATVLDLSTPLDATRVQWDKGNTSVINSDCLRVAPPLIEEDPI